jgi:hypothetical protein
MVLRSNVTRMHSQVPAPSARDLRLPNVSIETHEFRTR